MDLVCRRDKEPERNDTKQNIQLKALNYVLKAASPRRTIEGMRLKYSF